MYDFLYNVYDFMYNVYDFMFNVYDLLFNVYDFLFLYLRSVATILKLPPEGIFTKSTGSLIG